MGTTHTESGIGIERSYGDAPQGNYAVTREEERFYPIHEDPDERRRFVEFFGQLELTEQVEIVKAMGIDELLDGLSGDDRQRSAKLKGELAVWIERNEEFYQYRSGHLARLSGEELTWDEHPQFKKGWLDQLVKDLHSHSRPEGFGEREAALAGIHERSQEALKRHQDSEAEIHQTLGGSEGWQYVTVTASPRGGEVPDWVREAWVDTSLPIPPSAGDPETGERTPQEPEQEVGETYRTWDVWCNDAIVALLADGKREAAEYWMKNLQDKRHGGMLVFAELDCKLRGEPVFPGRHALAA